MNKKVAIIIAKSKFRDEEYIEPRKALESAGIEVKVFSSVPQTSKGMFGFEVTPDDIIANLNPEEFSGVIFVGGGGSKEYFDNTVAHDIAKNFNNKGKFVAAICIAPNILARAGLLKGKKVCSFPSVKDELISHGALVQQDGVASDGNIITGTGPEYAALFGQTIVNYLS